MSKQSDISSCSASPPNSYSQESVKARKTLEWSRFATFCLIQLILGGWSTILFLLAIVNKSEKNDLWVNLSILLALCGLVYLVISICNSFRYGTKAGKFFVLDGESLKKSTSKKILRTVFISSLIGICITFLGSTIMAAEIFSKILALQGGIFSSCQNTVFITFIDISISQACINIMTAHCAG